jgi:SAM-dependent methyltransferase
MYDEHAGLGKLDVISHEAEVELMTRYIDSMDHPLEILDAGCGRKWPIKLHVPYRLTGIDMDAEAIALRQKTRSDLSTVIIGDLSNTRLPDSSFDVIYCSYVLEHMKEVDRILANFLSWLKAGGLMIIRVPDRDSVYGWVTRHSPFWLHVLYKRWIGGIKNAGKPGFDPYPVYYEKTVSRMGMTTFCQKHNLTICETRGVGSYLRKSLLVRFAAVIGSVLSIGRLAWRHNNLLFIIRAPQ